MCQNTSFMKYMSYFTLMLVLLGSTGYSGYAFSKEHSLLLDKDCYYIPWANLAITGASLFLGLSIMTLLCCESMGCERQLAIGCIIGYILTNIWGFTIFWVMGDSCRKYYKNSHITFWWMNLVQYIVLAVIILVMTMNLCSNIWYRCCRSSRVDIY